MASTAALLAACTDSTVAAIIDAAERSGYPAFEVRASDGVTVLG